MLVPAPDEGEWVVSSRGSSVVVEHCGVGLPGDGSWRGVPDCESGRLQLKITIATHQPTLGQMRQRPPSSKHSAQTWPLIHERSNWTQIS